MRESRWHRRVAPAVVAVAAVVALASSSAGAADPPWVPPDCPAPVRFDAHDGRIEAWYRLDPELDDSGALQAVALGLGRLGEPGARTIRLAPESFATGPHGSVVVAGTDDGRASRLLAIDLAAGCSWTIALERDVVRRATVSPDGRTIFETRVDRRTRADRGVWERPSDGSGTARRVLGPIASDDRFGRTFSTELSWSVEGDRLVVQSCGEMACRTRIVDPSTGDALMVDDPGLGEALGLAGSQLITYADCRGLPCQLLGIDVEDGDRTLLATEAGAAVLVATDDGPRVVHEVGVGDHPPLRTVDTAGRELGRPNVLPPGVRLVPGHARAAGGMDVPEGWVLLGRDGRPPLDRGSAAFLRHVADGTTVTIEEVSR